MSVISQKLVIFIGMLIKSEILLLFACAGSFWTCYYWKVLSSKARLKRHSPSRLWSQAVSQGVSCVFFSFCLAGEWSCWPTKPNRRTAVRTRNRHRRRRWPRTRHRPRSRRPPPMKWPTIEDAGVWKKEKRTSASARVCVSVCQSVNVCRGQPTERSSPSGRVADH